MWLGSQMGIKSSFSIRATAQKEGRTVWTSREKLFQSLLGTFSARFSYVQTLQTMCVVVSARSTGRSFAWWSLWLRGQYTNKADIAALHNMLFVYSRRFSCRVEVSRSGVAAFWMLPSELFWSRRDLLDESLIFLACDCAVWSALALESVAVI